MKFFSIDVETSGLDSTYCDLLSVACIYVDTDQAILEINNRDNQFGALIKHEQISGEPFALRMNASLISRIANGEGMELDEAMTLMGLFIRAKLGLGEIGECKFTAAGKNFAAFDRHFLRFEDCEPNYRVLDLGPIYSRTVDLVPPGLKTCCERAGVQYDESKAHEALYDAQRVAACLWFHLNGAQGVGEY